MPNTTSFSHSFLKSTFVALLAAALVTLVVGCGAVKAPSAITTTTPPSSPSSPNPSATVTPGAPEPLAVAFNPATNLFYIANGAGNTVSVVDGASFKALDTITVQSNPSAIAVNSATNTVYAVNTGASSVSVIDGATNKIVSTLTGGNGNVAVNPVTNRIYVLDARGSENYNVTVLDGTTDEVIATLQVGGNASDIAVNSKTNMVYVTNSQTLIAIDGTTNEQVGTIPIPPPPASNPGALSICATQAAAVDETTNTIYFANGCDVNTVDVVSGDTFTVTKSIPVGNLPVSIAVDPQTHFVYVANSLDKTISVIDQATNTVTDTIALTDFPQGLVVNPAARLLYVAMDQSYGVVNLSTNQMQ